MRGGLTMHLQDFLDCLLVAVKDEFIAQVKRSGDKIILKMNDGTEFEITIKQL